MEHWRKNALQHYSKSFLELSITLYLLVMSYQLTNLQVTTGLSPQPVNQLCSNTAATPAMDLRSVEEALVGRVWASWTCLNRQKTALRGGCFVTSHPEHVEVEVMIIQLAAILWSILHQEWPTIKCVDMSSIPHRRIRWFQSTRHQPRE